jgi:hypothetical protein
MKPSIHIPLYAICLTLLISCSETKHAPQSKVTEPQTQIQKLASEAKELMNSFKEKSSSEMKSLLGEATLTENPWSDHGIPNVKGIEIIATYPNYEIIIYLANDSVIMSSFQVLAD